MEQMFVDVGISMIYLIVRLAHHHMQLVKIFLMTKCTLLYLIELVLSTGFRKDTAGERTNSVLETYAFVSKAFWC